MFIGRESELKTLNEHYAKNEFSCIPIYGRRRIGKSELIKEFIKDKKAILFLAKKGTHKENLEELSLVIYNNPNSAIFNKLDNALGKIHEMAQKEKLIFVIDEYPYLAESKKSVSSTLQHIIDHKFNNTNMMLILCGSSMSFMQNQVLGYESPLYGRRHGQIHIKPLDYKTSKLFAGSDFTEEEKAMMYGITGGIPKYLSLFDPEKDFASNVIREFFTSASFLFEEPENLLKQELKEPAIYNSVISAIATGGSQMKDIKGKTDLESSNISFYIKSLIELGIVEREIPIFEKPDSKKSVYKIADGMFRFWYRFIYKNMSLIDFGKGEELYKNIATEQLSSFMGEVFEKMAIEYMWDNYDNLPIKMQNLGRWWGTNQHKKSQEEIDFIAHDFDNKKAIFAECKWTNAEVPESVINDLIEKSDMFKFDEKYFYIFAKKGFTPAAIQKAENDSRIKLITFEEMF